ncbi:MAG: MBL fold metallo-hydrolase [Muribaculaceae bacterium]
MKILFLGTGTSTGVPQIGCHCRVCTSSDPRDKRYRASAMVEVEGKHLLIDCGPDFRSQILTVENPQVDAVLVTHSHYDHVGGFDDLRPFCYKTPMPVYGRADVLTDLRNRIPYCFREHLYPGVPTFDLREIQSEPFTFEGIEIEPLPVWHYKLPIVGYRIGNMAYITDAKTIDDSTLDRISRIDTLIINSLRIEPHMSHMSLSETLAVIERVKPRRAYLIHMSHQMGLHGESPKLLPEGVELAYDGMSITV